MTPLDDAPHGRVLWGHCVEMAGPAPEVLSALVAALSASEGWVVAWHGLAAYSSSVCVGVNIAVAPESAFDEGEMFDVEPQEVDALMEAAADDVEFSGADVKKARERFDIGRVEVESVAGLARERSGKIRLIVAK